LFETLFFIYSLLSLLDVSNVQDCIVSSDAQLIQSLLNQRKRVSILDDFLVELSIVNAETKRFILLFDEQNRYSRS
jgi:hypothetical protein